MGDFLNPAKALEKLHGSKGVAECLKLISRVSTSSIAFRSIRLVLPLSLPLSELGYITSIAQGQSETFHSYSLS